MKRKRLIWFSVIFLVAGMVAFMVVAPGLQPSMGQTISLLKGRSPVSSTVHPSYYFYLRGSSISSSPTRLWSYMEKYVLDMPFKEVQDKLRLELKHKAMYASAYPPKDPRLATYSFSVPGGVGHSNVIVQTEGPSRTSIIVQEHRPPNPLQTLTGWLDRLTSKKTRYEVVVARPIGTPPQTTPLNRPSPPKDKAGSKP